jgi:hypothetical protein
MHSESPRPAGQPPRLSWQKVAGVLRSAGYKQSGRCSSRNSRGGRSEGFSITDGRGYGGELRVEYWMSHEIYRDQQKIRPRQYLKALRKAGIPCRLEKDTFGPAYVVIETGGRP